MKVYVMDKKFVKEWNKFEKRTGLGNSPSNRDSKDMVLLMKRHFGKNCLPISVKVHPDMVECEVDLDGDPET